MKIFVVGLYEIARSAGYNVRQVDAMATSKYGKLNIADLTSDEYKNLYHTFYTRVIATNEVI